LLFAAFGSQPQCEPELGKGIVERQIMHFEIGLDKWFLRGRSVMIGAGLFVAVRLEARLRILMGELPKPRALARHLRRAQTFLRALGIDVAFGRKAERNESDQDMQSVSSVSIVGSVRGNGPTLRLVQAQTMLTALT
jgi:hypothetical protein